MYTNEFMTQREAELTAQLAARTSERDAWKEKYEYLRPFFDSAITERNELRLAKGSLILAIKDVKQQLATAQAQLEQVTQELETYKTAISSNNMTADAPYLQRHLAEIVALLGASGAEVIPSEITTLKRQLATMTLASRTAVEINHVHEDEIDTLREQLATARQTVWEEAAKKCHECLDMVRNDQMTWALESMKEMLHGRCQAFANLESWCREQAKKEAQP